MDSRKRMGKDKNGVIFPVAPNLSEMSDRYLDFIEKIKKEQQEKKIRADELKCICQKYGLPYSLATQLISTQISKEEIENRIIKILFYLYKHS